MNERETLAQEALAIFRAGVAAVDPYAAVRAFLRREDERLILAGSGSQPEVEFPLTPARRIRVIGAGKASARMAQALEEILGDRLERGLVTVKTGHTAPTQRIELVEAAHPVPDQAGLEAARRQLDLVSDLTEDDLVIALLSGGGSALLPLPAEGISLAEKQDLTSGLLAAGATIHEVNCVRKHISAIKGGQLARQVYPATLVTLVLSDVVGDDLDAIASGPTVADSTRFQDAQRVLIRRGLWEDLPTGIRRRFEAATAGSIPENPGPEDPVFERASTRVIGSCRLALEACARRARAGGWNTLLLSSRLQGEAREVARVLAAILREARETGRPVAAPACILAGGETTVTLRGSGRGGRNQELALAACLELEGEQGVVLFSGGTDGNDGPTDAAGGIACGDSLARARSLGLDLQVALDENDAYPTLETLGDLVRTGPTGTNVMDIQVMLVQEDGVGRA